MPASNRPGGGDRPGISGNRPGGVGNRPVIGGNHTNIGVNRPTIGGGNVNVGNVNVGRVNAGNSLNVNRAGNRNYVGNRPGWDHGWNNPGWGWGGGGWAGAWHGNCINPHHGWYNGCWGGGYWGSNWYRPLAWGAVGWGLGSLTSGWGYGGSYSNPYYEAPVGGAMAPYDYSQPVVVNNIDVSDADSGDVTVQTSPATGGTEADQATQLFDEGLALFKSADYPGALTKFDTALLKLPNDPVVHEVRALTLFALGQYKLAATALNSFLSSAPGMDWTTMSSLYGNTEDYQTQLRKLEQFCKTHPNDPSSAFVLAYQYLVLGDRDAAVNALKTVVKNQPKDATAKRMLDALSPPVPTPGPAAPDDNAPQTDLVGAWRAKAGDTTIDLAITEDSQFTWKANQPGKPIVELNGQLQSSSDELSLESKDQGAMAGLVKSLGADKWQFALDGAPPNDPGLTFARVKR
ncbi:MAG TPA: tetratricopeptide repeat protein [Pirellulales bacterium]